MINGLTVEDSVLRLASARQAAGLPPGDLRAAEADVLLSRMAWGRQHGLTFGDKRDMYAALGYPREITTKEYRATYARGGVAKRIVEALPKACWRGAVELVEDEDPKKQTTFEKAWLDLEKRLKIKSTLLRADILAGLSTYSIILLGAPGELDAELPKGSPDKLLYLTPFSGGGGPAVGQRQGMVGYDADATIETLEEDPANERFGLPKTYRLKRIDTTNPAFQKSVHWSRVIHVAEGCLDDEVYGVPTLEAVWNLLIDLDKVTGGGSEAFWLRANQGLLLNLDKDAELAEPARLALASEVEQYQHRMSRVMKTRAMTATTLGSDVANFDNPADAVLTQIAGTTTIPKRILTGSEMGELASSQDRDNWKDQVNGRQTGHCEPNILKRLADRLIAYGYLPTPVNKDGYNVRWAQMQVLTETEKSEGALKWAQVNATMGSVVFPDDEIRDHWYQYAPLTDEQKKKIEDEAAKKMEQQKEMLEAEAVAKGGKEDDEEELEEKQAFPRAAEAAQEDVETLALLEQAIASGNREVADQILAEHQPLSHVLRSVEAAITANDPETLGRLLGISAPKVLEAPAPSEPQTIVLNNTPPAPPAPQKLRLATRKEVAYDDQGRVVSIVTVPLEEAAS